MWRELMDSAVLQPGCLYLAGDKERLAAMAENNRLLEEIQKVRDRMRSKGELGVHARMALFVSPACLILLCVDFTPCSAQGSGRGNKLNLSCQPDNNLISS